MELDVTKSDETTATPAPKFETAEAHNLPLIGFAQADDRPYTEEDKPALPPGSKGMIDSEASVEFTKDGTILSVNGETPNQPISPETKITQPEIDAIKAVLEKEKRRKENKERFQKVDTQENYVLNRKFMNKFFWSLIIRRPDMYLGQAMKIKLGELFGATSYAETEEIVNKIRDEFLEAEKSK